MFKASPSDHAPLGTFASDSPGGDTVVTCYDRRLHRRTIAAALAAACGYFAVTLIVFFTWVHHYYADSVSGPLWISTFFGISQKSIDAGARPVFKAPMAGWDGQFYYTQSNDPFLRVDYSRSTLFDNLSYRYQRNGVPLLAHSLAMLSGQRLTSPWIYYLTQFLIVSVGFGALVGYLVHCRIAWWWACAWGFYGGVLRPLGHGLPDPTADALLLLSILALLRGKLLSYAFIASLLCLCRESYAAPAAAVWLLTLVGRIQWRSVWSNTSAYWPSVVATMLPGVAVLGWATYVAVQTGTGLLAGSRMIPWGGLIDWPFKAYATSVWADIGAADDKDILYASSCALCLAVVLAIVLGKLATGKLATGKLATGKLATGKLAVGKLAVGEPLRPYMIAILPHVILMTMTGTIVWEAGVGYFKNTSSIVLIGVLLLKVSDSRMLRIALVVTFVAGLVYVYRADIRHQSVRPPLPIEEVAAIGQLDEPTLRVRSLGQGETNRLAIQTLPRVQATLTLVSVGRIKLK